MADLLLPVVAAQFYQTLENNTLVKLCQNVHKTIYIMWVGKDTKAMLH